MAGFRCASRYVQYVPGKEGGGMEASACAFLFVPSVLSACATTGQGPRSSVGCGDVLTKPGRCVGRGWTGQTPTTWLQPDLKWWSVGGPASAASLDLFSCLLVRRKEARCNAGLCGTTTPREISKAAVTTTSPRYRTSGL